MKNKIILLLLVIGFLSVIFAPERKYQPVAQSNSTTEKTTDRSEEQIILQLAADGKASLLLCLKFKSIAAARGTCEAPKYVAFATYLDNGVDISFFTSANAPSDKSVLFVENGDQIGLNPLRNIEDSVLLAALSAMNFTQLTVSDIKRTMRSELNLKFNIIGKTSSLDRKYENCINGVTLTSSTADHSIFVEEYEKKGVSAAISKFQRVLCVGTNCTRNPVCESKNQTTAEATSQIASQPPNPMENATTDDPSAALCSDLDVKVTIDMHECLNRQYVSVDSELNQLWKQLMTKTLEPEKSQLLESQRSWISEKEEVCSKAGSDFSGGTFEAIAILDCTVRMTQERLLYLKSIPNGN